MLKHLGYAAGAFLAGLALGFPYLFLAPARVTDGLRGIAAHYPFPTLSWHEQILVSLRAALGTPLWLAALAGLGYALWRRSAADRYLLGFLAVYLGLLGLTARPGDTRFAMPVLPFLTLLLARFLVRAASIGGRLRRTATLLLVGVLLGYTLAQGWAWRGVFLREDPRNQAARWLEAREGVATSVAFDVLNLDLPIAPEAWTVVPLARVSERGPADWLVLEFRGAEQPPPAVEMGGAGYTLAAVFSNVSRLGPLVFEERQLPRDFDVVNPTVAVFRRGG